MKILFGITKSNFGGAQRYVFELASEAKRAGNEVFVMCGLPAQSGGDGPLIQKLNESGIQVIPLPHLGRDVSFIKDFKSFLFILRTLRKERPDVFHINSSKMGGLGGFAARLVGVKKIIFTAHGWAFNEPRSAIQKTIIKFFVWLTIILSHKTICVSEKTKKDVSNLPFIKNKLVIIYNGLKDFELKTREEARKILSLDDNVFLVGAVSELHKIKGLDILLKAWAAFLKNHKAKLVIFGAGEEKNNLNKIASNLKIDNSVEFKGFVGNARSFLSSFDIFVMPSRSEAMPYALLEAGFAGLPVVASSVGGIPEIIENEKNGLLVPKENSEALLSALNRLADNKEFREKLGSSLKQTISTKFSFEKMVQKTFELYT